MHAPTVQARKRNAATSTERVQSAVMNTHLPGSQSESRRADAEQHFQSLKGEHGATEWPYSCIKSDAERIDLWDSILRDKTKFLEHEDLRLRGKSIEDLLTDPNFCGYFGTTMCQIIEEWLRWLTKRGAMPMGNNALDTMLAQPPKQAKGAPKAKAKRKKGDDAYGKNRPVLTKPNGSCIGGPFAKKKLGFKVAKIHDDVLLYNITSLERMAQRSLEDSSRALGEPHFPRSLHRVAGAGADGRYQDLEAIHATVLANEVPPMVTLFMTYSFELRQHLADDLVVFHP